MARHDGTQPDNKLVASATTRTAYLAMKLVSANEILNKKSKEIYLCAHENLNLAGPRPGFDSKSEQLASITIQTEPASTHMVRYSFGG